MSAGSKRDEVCVQGRMETALDGTVGTPAARATRISGQLLAALGGSFCG